VATSVVPRRKTLQARIVSGSVVLLSGSGLNTAINLAYNIVVARFLGPKGFGHATVIYTILVLLSAATLAIQIIATKMIAQQESAAAKSSIYRFFHRAAWICGVVVALSLVAFQGGIADYLNLPAASLVSIIAIGAAFYVPLGARRGFIQGTYGFRNLAANLVTEQAVRLLGSLGLIAAGWGLYGVIAANSAAIAIAYYTARVKLTGRLPIPIRFSHAAHETFQAAIFFAGQMVINNGGIVLVNHFLLAREAGYYAAVAMVGRVIFSFSQAVVNSTFPLVAGTSNEERRDLRVIATALLLVDASVRSGFCDCRQIQPALSSCSLCSRNRHLLACRCHYHIRNVLQDRKHQLGTAGVQWGSSGSDLPLPLIPPRSCSCSARAHGSPVHLCSCAVPDQFSYRS
jgi:O-antigen/teichoic acid export membrane protein